MEWFALGGRLAVAAGAACALLSLFWDAPPSAAALRGFVAWFIVRLHFRLSARALDWRLHQDAREGETDGEAPNSAAEAA